MNNEDGSTRTPKLMFFVADRSVPQFSATDLESKLVGTNHLFITIPDEPSKPVYVGYETEEEVDNQYKALLWRYSVGKVPCEIQVEKQIILPQKPEHNPRTLISSGGRPRNSNYTTPERQRPGPGLKARPASAGPSNPRAGAAVNRSASPANLAGAETDKVKSKLPPVAKCMVIVLSDEFSGNWGDCVSDIDSYLKINYQIDWIKKHNEAARAILLDTNEAPVPPWLLSLTSIINKWRVSINFEVLSNNYGSATYPLIDFHYSPSEVDRFNLEEKENIRVVESCYRVRLITQGTNLVVFGHTFDRLCAINSTEFARVGQSTATLNPSETYGRQDDLTLSVGPVLQTWFFVKSAFVMKKFRVEVNCGVKNGGQVVLKGASNDVHNLELFLKSLSYMEVSYPATRKEIWGAFKSKTSPPECCLYFPDNPALFTDTSATETSLFIIGSQGSILKIDNALSGTLRSSKKELEIKCEKWEHFYVSSGFKEVGNNVTFKVNDSMLKIESSCNLIRVTYESNKGGIQSFRTGMLISFLTNHDKGKNALKQALNFVKGAYVLNFYAVGCNQLEILIPENSKSIWTQEETRLINSLVYFEKDFVKEHKSSGSFYRGRHADLLKRYIENFKEDCISNVMKQPTDSLDTKLDSLNVRVFGLNGPNWELMKEYLQRVEPISKIFANTSDEAQVLKEPFNANGQRTKFLHSRVWSTIHLKSGNTNLIAIHPDDWAEALDRLESLINAKRDNTVVQNSITLDSYMITRLVLYDSHVQNQIKERGFPCTVKFPNRTKVQLGLEISLKGKVSQCVEAIKRIEVYLKDLKASIVSYDIHLKPFEFGCIGSKTWWHHYKSIMDVDYEVKNDRKPVTGGYIQGLLREVTLQNGFIIQIRAGDIIRNLDVDAIVSAADGFLQHGGGVASRICIAAGESFKSQCTAYIDSNGSLPTTKAVALKAGNLPNHYIINAVAPVYFAEKRPGHTKEELLQTFQNIARCASENKIQSIAMPAVGTQAFRNPLEDVVEAIFLLIREESKKVNPLLKLIRLSDLDSKVLDVFVHHFDTMFANQKVRKWAREEIEKPATYHPNYTWSWQEDNGLFTNYDEDSNWLIDQASQLNQSSVTLSIPMTLSTHGTRYKIMLDQMTQINETSNYRRKIKKEVFSNLTSPTNPISVQSEAFEDLAEMKQDEEDEKATYIVSVSHLAGRIDSAVAQFKDTIQKCIQKKPLSVDISLKNDEFATQVEAIMIGHHVDVSKNPQSEDDKSLIVSGEEDCILNAMLSLYEAAREILKSENVTSNTFPRNWTSQEDNFALISIPKGSQEWIDVESRFRKTSPFLVTDIQRIQNKLIWSNFLHTIHIMKEAEGKDPETKLLFHGTGKNDPSKIYDDPNHKGFTMQYCEKGLWGIGTYFAQNASYSVKYSYTSPKGRQMFLAEVITGNYIKLRSDPMLRLPPNMPDSTKRYTSVKGKSGVSDIYIVYDNGMAYPRYLITFQ
eukprot:TRINITY_DN14364_c0_g1_i1.p1 TRINITY_DN14364_c0_g1~~TRINITY_DN14364_c0_g1_i1.p1  ORF type:complete len:1476 (+),score=225.07 TRINITY_DN14364_c0_g1_i1:45-4472(+)